MAPKMKTAMSVASLLCLLAAFFAEVLQLFWARPNLVGAAPPLVMQKDEIDHVLSAFSAATANGNASASKDTVWARRTYAPLHIHGPALTRYRAQLEKAFPTHAITFDVVFAAADNAVPWHADFDSLGPFVSSVASISDESFITVHANLVEGGAGGGQLRTLDSSLVAALHYVTNRLMGTFGAADALSEPLAAGLGATPRTHDGKAGVGNAFNNLKAHAVTAGSGRISYVVRLVRRDVLLSRAKLLAAARGEASTRRIGEFEKLLPHFPDDALEQLPVGDFPWAQVQRTE